MDNRRPTLQAFLAVLIISFVVIAWDIFLPVQFGGQTAFAVVNGNSMEPELIRGDLAVLRCSKTYTRGDIIAFFNPDMRRYIIHRIIGEDQDRYITKGDNNPWVDTYKLSRGEIIGKLWFEIPGIGKLVQWLQSPIRAAIAAATMGGGLGLMTVMERPRRKKKERKAWLSFKSFEGKVPNWKVESLFLMIGTLGLLSLVLAVVAFKNPLWVSLAEDKPYRHLGVFYYSADVPSGIYDSNRVDPGEPLYLRQSCQVNLGYQYLFNAAHTQDLSGTHSLIAEISDSHGWRRRIQIQPEEKFDGNSYTSTTVLDICQVQAIIDQFTSLTGVHLPEYSLSILPLTTISGKLDGENVHDDFEPRIQFMFDGLQFWLLQGNAGEDPLKPSKSGFVRSYRMEVNDMAILGFKLAILDARYLAVYGLFLSMLGGVVLAFLSYVSSKGDPNLLIRSKYGPLLVEVNHKAIETPVHVVDVARIDDLAKLASKHDSMILHVVEGSTNKYLVQNAHILYRYTCK